MLAPRIAKFEFVSRERFAADCSGISQKACELKLPLRATSGSAGYDLITPFDIALAPGESMRVPTGLRCRMEKGWVMLIFPRSGLGFRYRMQLDNTVGVVDEDYYGADNEGHIIVQVTNDSRSGKELEIEAGKAFAQAVFLPYGITTDDEASARRTGGLGSTDRRDEK